MPDRIQRSLEPHEGRLVVHHRIRVRRFPQQVPQAVHLQHRIVGQHWQIVLRGGRLRRRLRGESDVSSTLTYRELIRLDDAVHAVYPDEIEIRACVQEYVDDIRRPPRAVDIDRQRIDRLEGIGERPGVFRKAGEHERLGRGVLCRIVFRRTEAAHAANVLLGVVLAFSPLLVEILVVELHHDHRATPVMLFQVQRDPPQVSGLAVQRRGIVRAQRRTARVVLDFHVVNDSRESPGIVLDVVRGVLRIARSLGQLLALPADIGVEQIHDQLEPRRCRAIDEPVKEREFV